MKQTNLLKTMLLLCCLLVGGSAWADYEEVYTLNGTITGGTSAYDSESSITQNEMNWGVVGNTNTNPWRIGGKSLSGVNRAITGKTAFSEALNKITFNHNGTTSTELKVNSVTLTVASDASFTSVIDEVVMNPSVAKNTAGSFDFVPTDPLTEWDANSYYKITINVSNSKSSNYGFTVNSIVFYKIATKPATTVTIDDSGLTNTYLNNGTVAGSLSASVTLTSGGTAVPGAIVTWESSNESVATITDAGVVTLVAEGNTTITASYAGSDDYLPSSKTYNLTVSDTRTAPGLAYAEAKQTAFVGEKLDAPTLTNPNSLAVTFESGNDAVATVDASGNVTGIKAGSTTITASFEGNSTYKPGSASYKVIVIPAGALFYEGINSYLGTGDGSEISTSYANLDSEDWNTLTKIFPGKVLSGDANGHIKFGSSSAKGTAVTKAIALTGTGKLTYKVQRYDSSNSGNLKISVTGATASGDVDVTGTATWVEKTVTLTEAAGSVVITFETTSEDPRIRVDDILVVSKQPISISDAGLATYASNFDLDFTSVDGIEAYIAKEEAGAVKLTKVNKVPAGTGVLLRSTSGGAVAKDVPVAASADAIAENIFVRGTGATVATDAGAGKTNYVLGKKSGVVGFYKANGATVGADKAYLQTTLGSAARIDINFDDATAIEAVKAQNVENGQFFNLAGQRVAQPTKGLYIVNGKKVIIK